jgi:hypothetical protein
MGRYRYNGEYWYRDMQSWLGLLLRWFVSIGGWQMPHWTVEGYTYRWKARHAIRLSLRARGHRSWLFALYASACPLSLFGGRITFNNFGVSYWSRRRRAWYCLHYDFTGKNKRMRWYAYRSVNATPWGADTWYFGAPREVLLAAKAQHDQMAAAREEREARLCA